MSTPYPGMFAVAIGGASILCTVAIGLPEIGLGLSQVALGCMVAGSLGPAGQRRQMREYQSRPRERCRCGNCEQCDPLAPTWGGNQ